MIDMNEPWHIANDPAPGWEGHVYGANGMIVATASTQEVARRIVDHANRVEELEREHGALLEALDLIASGINSDARSVVIARAAIDAATKLRGSANE